jgi:hypothetical protein
MQLNIFEREYLKQLVLDDIEQIIEMNILSLIKRLELLFLADKLSTNKHSDIVEIPRSLWLEIPNLPILVDKIADGYFVKRKALKNCIKLLKEQKNG